MMRAMQQRISRWTVFALCGALLTVCALGLWHLESSPTMWYDDGFVALAAKTLAEQGVYGVYTAPERVTQHVYWLTTGPSVVLPIAGVYALFGTSILAARLVMFAYLLGVAAMTFVVARRLSSAAIAAWSTWLVVSYAPFYGNGKAMLGESPGVLWLLMATWCWLRGTDGRTDRRWLVAASVAFGLCVITKPSYLLVLPAIAIGYGIHAWRTRSVAWADVAALGTPLGLIITAWLWLMTPPPFFQGLGTAFTFFLNSTGRAMAEGQVVTNLLRFVTESTLVHLTLLLLGVLIALFVARRSTRLWHPAILTLGVLTALTLVWYIRTPGWYRYQHPIHLLALLFFPIALWRIRFAWIRPWMRSALLGLLIAIQLPMTIRGIDTYRSLALHRIPHEIPKIVGEDRVFLAHIPEAAVVLPFDRIEQAVFINPRLTIGHDRFAVGDLPRFVLVSPPDGVGVPPIEPILQSQYPLRWTGGHYRLFELIVP